MRKKSTKWISLAVSALMLGGSLPSAMVWGESGDSLSVPAEAVPQIEITDDGITAEPAENAGTKPEGSEEKKVSAAEAGTPAEDRSVMLDSYATEEGTTVFDFDKYDFSDPAEELNAEAEELYGQLGGIWKKLWANDADRIQQGLAKVKKKIDRDAFPTDQSFFGIWNPETGAFGIGAPDPETGKKYGQGLLNYDYVSAYGFDLKDVEEAARAGDYTAAKKALLTYYQNVTHARDPEVPELTDQNVMWANLALRNFHINASTGRNIADIFHVTGEEKLVSLDMKDSIELYRNGDTRLMPVTILGVDKDDYQAEFYSKESGKGPYLEVEAGGKKLTISPADDAYVQAGIHKEEVHGNEFKLYAREAESDNPEKSTAAGYPVCDDTTRTYLMFDLSDIKQGDEVTSAKLYLRGKWVDMADQKRNDPAYQKMMVGVTHSDTSWNEKNLTYLTNKTSSYSFQGNTATIYWGMPAAECMPCARQDEETTRLGSWWDLLVKQYYATGNEDYARAAILYLHDFIKTTFNIERGYPGTPGEHVGAQNNAKYGLLLFGGYSKTLDLHSRLMIMSSNLFYLYDSKYMTPEVFTAFMKYLWCMADLEISDAWGGSEAGGNWGTAAANGQFNAMAYFPEFADCGRWKTAMDQHLNQVTAEICRPDGSSKELSHGYTSYALGTQLNNKVAADLLKIDFEYDHAIKERIRQLTTYLMAMGGPGYTDPQYGDGSVHTRDYVERIRYVGDWLRDPALLWAGHDGKLGKEPDYTSRFYPDGKIMAMRSDWGKNARYLYTNADAANGTHAHWDDMAVIVAAYGEYLLADPLYYSYTGDTKHRWLVSSRGHNTAEINDHCQGSLQGSTMDTCLPRAGSQGDFQRVDFRDSYDFTRINSGTNYRDLYYRFDPSLETDPTGNLDTYGQKFDPEPGMDFTRNILFVKPNFWIISDYMDPVDKEKENKYSQYWHMKPGAKMAIDGQAENVYAEDIMKQTEGKTDDPIGNGTEFVPGAGTGAFLSNNTGSANIMVVPANAEEMVPTLSRGLYSYGQGSLTTTPYGRFDKKVQGKTTMDTILFPTAVGESYSVDPTELPLDLEEAAASAMSARVRQTEGNGNTDYTFTYYLLHELDKQKEITVGNYATDGTLAYYERSKNGVPRRVILHDAAHYKNQVLNKEIVVSDKKTESLAVEWNGAELRIEAPEDFDPKELNLNIYAPIETKKVFLNDQAIPFGWENQYAYFGEKQEDGSLIPPPDVSPTAKPTQKPGGGHGSVSGGGGGGGQGGILPPLATAPPAGKPSDAFRSELAGHWGEQEIASLVDRGIVKGADGTLQLASAVTRAEFVTMVLRALGKEETAYQNTFSDVTGGDWYAGYIQTAFDLQILKGTDGNALPNADITREEAAAMLMRAMEVKKAIAYGEKDVSAFLDAEQISDWAVPYISEAVRMKILNGMEDGTFAPGETALREQAMVMIYRMIQQLEQ